MDELAVVGEEQEDRRLDLGLHRVVEPQVGALADRHWRLVEHGLAQEGVELAGGHALVAVVPDLAGELDEATDALAGEGGDKDNRRVADELKGLAHALLEVVVSLVILLDRIPLIDQQGHALLLLQDHAGDMCILGGDAIGGIDQQQGHIAALDGAQGAQHGVLLDTLLDLARAADACGVDQRDPLAVHGDRGVDAVAGGARRNADYAALLADQLIEQAGLADVGAAHNGDAQVLILHRVGLVLGEDRDHQIEHIAGAEAVEGAHGDRFAQVEGVELHRV